MIDDAFKTIINVWFILTLMAIAFTLSTMNQDLVDIRKSIDEMNFCMTRR